MQKAVIGVLGALTLGGLLFFGPLLWTPAPPEPAAPVETAPSPVRVRHSERFRGPVPLRMPALPLEAVLDANADGEIAADEIERAPESLKQLDRNGDGQLTEDELGPRLPFFGGFGAGRGIPGDPPGRGSPDDQLMPLLQRPDENRGDSLDRAERPAGRRGHLPQRRPLRSAFADDGVSGVRSV